MAHLRLVPGYIGETGAGPLMLLGQMASRWPSPTNAQALAALTAFTESGDAFDAIQIAGERPEIALAYYAPTGILPRMRLLAAGFVKKGDTYKQPTDKAWWSKKYAYPLWPVLRAWIKNAKMPASGPTHLSDDVANGDPAAIGQELVALDGDLQTLNEAGLLGTKPPYLIPSSETLPITNHKIPIGVVVTCKDKRTGKMCWPLNADGTRNTNCDCSSTVIDPGKEIADRAGNALLLIVLLVLLAKGN